jgi:hypothetical protein
MAMLAPHSPEHQTDVAVLQSRTRTPDGAALAPRPEGRALQRSIGNQAVLRQQALARAELGRAGVAATHELRARGGAQRQSGDDVPQVVRDTLATPGKPLGAETRAHFERRFEVDFGQVRVHDDAIADKSARSVNAVSYAVGEHIVFRHGAFAPDTAEGQGLVAHELAHVVQDQPGVHRQVAAPDSGVPAVSAKGSLKPSDLPGFNQGEYASCGAASIVTALITWDREDAGGSRGATAVLAACDLAMHHLENNRRVLKDNWQQKNPGTSSDETYALFVRELGRVRDEVLQTGGITTQDQYETISAVFYGLFMGGAAGLSRGARDRLLEMLGLYTERGTEVSSFDQIFSNPIITKLEPGRIAQVMWYVLAGPPVASQQRLALHYFLIGRLEKNGTWFLSDQGTTPPVELETSDLLTLKRGAIARNRYWMGPAPGTEGTRAQAVLFTKMDVTLLGQGRAVAERAQTIALTPGNLLAEVDAGPLTSGDAIAAVSFVTRVHSEADGMTSLMAIPAGQGGVMVEDPIGVFHVFTTTTVSGANLRVRSVDKSDSAGAKLDPANRRFHSAWLRLSTPTIASPVPIKLYP